MSNFSAISPSDNGRRGDNVADFMDRLSTASGDQDSTQKQPPSHQPQAPHSGRDSDDTSTASSPLPTPSTLLGSTTMFVSVGSLNGKISLLSGESGFSAKRSELDREEFRPETEFADPVTTQNGASLSFRNEKDKEQKGLVKASRYPLRQSSETSSGSDGRHLPPSVAQSDRWWMSMPKESFALNHLVQPRYTYSPGASRHPESQNKHPLSSGVNLRNSDPLHRTRNIAQLPHYLSPMDPRRQLPSINSGASSTTSIRPGTPSYSPEQTLMSHRHSPGLPTRRNSYQSYPANLPHLRHQLDAYGYAQLRPLRHDSRGTMLARSSLPVQNPHKVHPPPYIPAVIQYPTAVPDEFRPQTVTDETALKISGKGVAFQLHPAEGSDDHTATSRGYPPGSLRSLDSENTSEINRNRPNPRVGVEPNKREKFIFIDESEKARRRVQGRTRANEAPLSSVIGVPKHASGTADKVSNTSVPDIKKEQDENDIAAAQLMVSLYHSQRPMDSSRFGGDGSDKAEAEECQDLEDKSGLSEYGSQTSSEAVEEGEDPDASGDSDDSSDMMDLDDDHDDEYKPGSRSRKSRRDSSTRTKKRARGAQSKSAEAADDLEEKTSQGSSRSRKRTRTAPSSRDDTDGVRAGEVEGNKAPSIKRKGGVRRDMTRRKQQNKVAQKKFREKKKLAAQQVGYGPPFTTPVSATDITKCDRQMKKDLLIQRDLNDKLQKLQEEKDRLLEEKDSALRRLLDENGNLKKKLGGVIQG